jgi:hypothetical protein
VPVAQTAPSVQAIVCEILYKLSVSQILPGGHSRHSRRSLVPLSKLKVPRGHAKHTLLWMTERNIPTGQIVGRRVSFTLHSKPLGHCLHSVDLY